MSDDITKYTEAIGDSPTLEEVIVTPSGVVVGTRTVTHPAVRAQREAQKLYANALNDAGSTRPLDRGSVLAEVKALSKLERLK